MIKITITQYRPLYELFSIVIYIIFILTYGIVHLILLQSVWQLHLILFRTSSGAGGKSVSTGISFPSLSFHPHSRGLISSPLLFHFSKLGGCGILQQLKCVAGFVDECRKCLKKLFHRDVYSADSDSPGVPLCKVNFILLQWRFPWR